MKILFDHQIFTSQKYGGISRYFFELIKNIDNIEVENATLFSYNHYLISDNSKKCISFFPKINFRGKQRSLLFLNNTFSKLKIINGNFDIFHPTYYDPYFLKYLNGKPFVLTVYDMIHEKFDETFPQDDKTSYYKKILVNKAVKIIAISENTKKDLIDLFGVEKSKIEVVYLGNSMLLNNDVNIDFNFPKNFILFVGIRKGYKNFDRFIKSIAKLLHENVDLLVVCVSGGKFNNEELELFEKLNIQRSVLQYDLEDNQLAQFYARALVFVFPSLYEGFGIPVLESFACSCPLICSNTSSLPEIAADGAEYFDPYSQKSIYTNVKKVLESLELRNTLIKNGNERLKYFSWEKTAQQTKKIYESIII